MECTEEGPREQAEADGTAPALERLGPTELPDARVGNVYV